MLRLTTLLGLGSVYSAEGFSAGFSAARTGRHLGWNCSGAWCISRQLLNEHRIANTACLKLSNRYPNVSRPPCMTAGGGGAGEGDPEATVASPRLKRVRRRRKDAGSVATSGEEGESDSASHLSIDQQQPEQPRAVDLEVTRAAGEASAATQEGVLPRTPATPTIKVSRVSVGGTKGTKVRVDSSDDDIANKLASAASAASGAAGDAAFAVSDVAKSAIGAAMSKIGQGNGASEVDDLDEAFLASGKRQAATPKKLVDMADLGADIERYRKQKSGQRVDSSGEESLASGAKDLISTVITIDFFVVIAFMLWFIAGVISSYGFSNSFLLDQFNDKWTPVVQPALGVLMGGTIAGGVFSKLGESGGDEELKR